MSADGGNRPVPTLLISGTVGVGKSTITSEVSDVLSVARIPHAAVDLDHLRWHWPRRDPWNLELMFENLGVLWSNYLRHGARQLVVGHVVEDENDLERYQGAVPGAEITVCRLVASERVRLERLNHRMAAGPAREWHLRRSRELDTSLDRVKVEDFTVENEGRPVRTVALEVLVRSGRLSEDEARELGVTWLPPDTKLR